MQSLKSNGKYKATCKTPQRGPPHWTPPSFLFLSVVLTLPTVAHLLLPQVTRATPGSRWRRRRRCGISRAVQTRDATWPLSSNRSPGAALSHGDNHLHQDNTFKGHSCWPNLEVSFARTEKTKPVADPLRTRPVLVCSRASGPGRRPQAPAPRYAPCGKRLGLDGERRGRAPGSGRRPAQLPVRSRLWRKSGRSAHGVPSTDHAGRCPLPGRAQGAPGGEQRVWVPQADR